MATLSTAARNAACDAVVDLIDGGAGAGTIEFQTSGDVEVATLTFSDPAFGAASTGVATASAITADSSATGGTIAKVVFKDSNGTVVITPTVGSGSGEIDLSSLTVGAGATVSLSSLTVTMPAS